MILVYIFTLVNTIKYFFGKWPCLVVCWWEGVTLNIMLKLTTFAGPCGKLFTQEVVFNHRTQWRHWRDLLINIELVIILSIFKRFQNLLWYFSFVKHKKGFLSIYLHFCSIFYHLRNPALYLLIPSYHYG